MYFFLFFNNLYASNKISPGLSGVSLPSLSLSFSQVNSPENLVASLKIVLLLTILSLAPAILILMTSFTRIIIVLSFIRQALGIQQMPPNQLLIGLALFLTFFVMQPTIASISDNAIAPYIDHKISEDMAFKNFEIPLKEFMMNQTRENDLELFLSLSSKKKVNSKSDVPIYILVPSFIISELKTAFQIGFMLYLPFLVLDIVIASILMSMGMMMVPPAVIALPCKLILFVLVDGWNLIIGNLVKSFY